MDRNDILKLTVISVVYNEADRIADTIASVTGQDYDNIEYIIKDGGSTDGTLEIIKNSADRFNNIKYVSESDRGLYDAMNIALDMATGDVVHFLNAGDRFVSPDVVSKALAVMKSVKADMVFGNVIYEGASGEHTRRMFPQYCTHRLYYLTGDVINHQVLFLRKELFDKEKFDISYRICADREWMLRIRAYAPVRKMVSLGFYVAIYPVDGISTVETEIYSREAGMCIRRHMLWGYPVYALFKLARSHARSARLLHRIYNLLFVERG